jgi:hypothetical protein
VLKIEIYCFYLSKSKALFPPSKLMPPCHHDQARRRRGQYYQGLNVKRKADANANEHTTLLMCILFHLLVHVTVFFGVDTTLPTRFGEEPARTYVPRVYSIHAFDAPYAALLSLRTQKVTRFPAHPIGAGGQVEKSWPRSEFSISFFPFILNYGQTS